MHLKNLSRWLHVEDWCDYFFLESAQEGCINSSRWLKMEFVIAVALISQVIFFQRTHPLCLEASRKWESSHCELKSSPWYPPTTDALEPQSSIWYRAELSSSPVRVSLLSPYLSIHAQEVCVYQAFLSMAIGVITRDGRYFLCSHN